MFSDHYIFVVSFYCFSLGGQLTEDPHLKTVLENIHKDIYRSYYCFHWILIQSLSGREGISMANYITGK